MLGVTARFASRLACCSERHDAEPLAHAVRRDHPSRQHRGPLQVIAGAGAHLAEYERFGDVAADRRGDARCKLTARLILAVLGRQEARVATGAPTPDDRDLVHGVVSLEKPRYDGVPGLV